MALSGAGAEGNPWLITTMAELLTVLRDAGGSGFYRIANALDTSVYHTLAPITTAVGGAYAAKVIDGDGFAFKVAVSHASSSAGCSFAGIHFRNVTIEWSGAVLNTTYYALFYQCSLVDVAIYASATSMSVSAASQYLLSSSVSTPYLIPRAVVRVVLMPLSAPAGDQTRFLKIYLDAGTASSCYVYSSGTVGGGLVKLAAAPTLALLDGLSSGAFSAAAWWESLGYLLPWQADLIALTLQTTTAAGAVSRMCWIESERHLRYLGETDAGGAAQFTARIRKRSGYSVIVAEDMGSDDLYAGLLVASGRWYLPPSDNGFVYQAGGQVRITSLEGVLFGAAPVVIDGVTFTPRPRYAPAISTRRSAARGGSSATIVLDNSGGGGGPVLEGDPAYLDGVVEEIHPMLGTVRALANAEVLAFERRGSEYVAMGSAYSNTFGEFRVETEVYGGGDIFAFAADFPGVIWQAGVVLNLGERVRPTVNNGYVYEVITAGNSGATEPAWWADAGDGTEGAIGSATAQARPYYQPVGHGPLKMILVE